ncbi:hypothetical protein BCR33DRAFT_852336 [Rhizoclosmatium globosum]|uniref:Uncharacterized protein n=1 Tax=Rhizoclosmatium globosum TaxID=329046 RepID=A0A1Y2C2W7_9FUNG|nr:hypothetical protein BCR33DRAFT_852336 [Rhizoclosmatium globosum]|eukprot:ORY41351.1 hypothetical protein BCR33DRAFT_852336 [Rhizoclosmatium globosum]
MAFGMNDKIAVASGNNPPNTETLIRFDTKLKRTVPSCEHLHTFAYFILHLQRVADHAKGGEYIIRYADLIFGNIDLVGRETVASLPYSETPSAFPELEDDPGELPPWDSTIDDLEPRLMRHWFKDLLSSHNKITPSPGKAILASFGGLDFASLNRAADLGSQDNCLSPIGGESSESNNTSVIKNNTVVSSANASAQGNAYRTEMENL